MGLGWLVPAFLAGLAAVVVPILVHLRQKERREPIRFPSLMFLRRVPFRTIERRRLTNPWLLLLRALAVAALVAAFARPFWRREDQRPAAVAASRAVIVAIDRSMSMSYRGVWERARDSALAVLASVGPGDRSAVIAFDESAEVVAPLATDPAAARSVLATLQPTGRGSRLAPAVRVARELAGQSRGLAVEIIVFSDLQRHALAGLEAAERVPGASMRFVPVGERNPANARVVDVDVDRRAEGGRTRLAVSAQVATKGDVPREVAASLVVNGRSLTTARARLAPNASARIQFAPVWIAEGDAAAAVAIEPDALVADDTLRFSLASAAGVPVVVLLPPGAGSDETLYLERALSISRAPALAVIVRRGTALPAADLDRARVVVVADVGVLTAAGGAALEAYARKGGGLILVAGARGTGPGVEWAPARIGRVVDRVAERGGRLGLMDGDHPIFEPFKEALASDFGAARFFRYRDLAPDSTAQVVARFDDGRPALVERRVAGGRVFTMALSVNATWADFALQPVFLPMVQRLVGYAGQVQNEKRWYAVGEAVTLPDVAGALTVSSPAGPDRRLPRDSTGRTVVVDALGVYQVRTDLSAAPIARIMVNSAAAESDLSAADPREVLAQLRSPSDSSRAPNVAPLTAIEQERTQSWWLGLLALALALLAAETVYAGRLQGKAGIAGGVR
jgi:hypothetical protein